MDSLKKVYTALQNELKELSEGNKTLKSTISGRVTNDIESLKTTVINSLEQKKFRLLAEITTSEKLNQDAGKIHACAERLAADFAKLSSNPTPSLDSIKAFEQQVLEVKAVIEAINGGKSIGLAYEKVLRDVKASIDSLNLGDCGTKEAQPTKASDGDNSMWLLKASTDKNTTSHSSSNSVGPGERENLSFWLRPNTTLRPVDKGWCDATSQWFKFASTMEWLNPRAPAPYSPASVVSSNVKPETSSRADSVVTSWKNFANSVEWYKPKDATVKTDEPSAVGSKKGPDAPLTSARVAGECFAAWAATAQSQTWLAATSSSSQKVATPPTSVPSDCIWLAGNAHNTRGAPALAKDIFSNWSKSAAEMSWVTKKVGASTPDSSYSWLSDPSLNWVVQDKRPAPPTLSEETTPPQPAVREKIHIDVWLPKVTVQTQRTEDETFTFPSYGSDDSMWLASNRPQALPSSSFVPSDVITDWLLPSPTSGLNDDDSQDFEIVDDTLVS